MINRWSNTISLQVADHHGHHSGAAVDESAGQRSGGRVALRNGQWCVRGVRIRKRRLLKF